VNGTVRKSTRQDIDVAAVERSIRCDGSVNGIIRANVTIVTRRTVMKGHGKCRKVQECGNINYQSYIYYGIEINFK
jgi:hypothetical protein